jgi:hypothetical protein
LLLQDSLCDISRQQLAQIVSELRASVRLLAASVHVPGDSAKKVSWRPLVHLLADDVLGRESEARRSGTKSSRRRYRVVVVRSCKPKAEGLMSSYASLSACPWQETAAPPELHRPSSTSNLTLCFGNGCTNFEEHLVQIDFGCLDLHLCTRLRHAAFPQPMVSAIWYPRMI